MRPKETVLKALNAMGMDISMLMSGDVYTCDLNDSNVTIVPAEYLNDYRRDWEDTDFHVVPATEQQQAVLDEYATELDYLETHGMWYEDENDL